MSPMSVYITIRSNSESKLIKAARENGKYNTNLAYEVNGKPCNLYDFVKRTKLKAWTPNAYFEFKPSLSDSTAVLSGLMYFDIDGLTNVLEAKKTVSSLPFVEACWVSFGGNGLGFTVRVPEMEKTEFSSNYRRISAYLSQILGHELDSTSDYSRRCVMSYDPDIYINKFAGTFDMSVLPAEKQKPKVNVLENENDYLLDNIVSGLGVDVQSCSLPTVFDKVEADKGAFVEGNTHNFTMSLIGHMNVRGISPDTWIPEFESWLSDRGYLGAYDEEKFLSRVQSYEHQLNEEASGVLSYVSGSFSVLTPNYSIANGQYLSDIIDVNTLEDSTMIVAPVGSGKSHFSLNVLADITGKLVFVAPQQSIITNLESSYVGGKTVSTFYEKNKDFSGDIILTTYNSLPGLFGYIKDQLENYTIVLDEIHTLVTTSSHSFRYKVNSKVVSLLPELTAKAKVIALTATYTEASFNNLFNLVKVEDRRTPYKELNIVKHSGEQLPALYELALSCFETSEKVIIYKENKDVEALAKKLSKKGKRVAVVNASVKEEADYITVVNEGDITNFDILITTSVLKEGVSVYGAKNVAYILASPCHYTDVEQLTSRVRDYQLAKVYTLYQEDRYFKFRSNFNSVAIKESLRNEALSKINFYNELGVERGMETSLELNNSSLAVKYSSDIRSWELDEVYLDHLVYKYEAMVCENNPAYFLNGLISIYGYDIQPEVFILTPQKLDISIELEEVNNNKAEKKAKLILEVVEKLQGQSKTQAIDLLENLSKDTKDRMLSELAYYSSVVLSYALHDDIERAINFAASLTKNSFTLFIKQLKIQELLTSETTQNAKKGLGIQQFVKDVAAYFTIGTKIEASKAQDIMEKLAKKHKAFDNGAKASLNMLFTICKINTVRKRENGKRVTYYTVLDNTASIEGYSYYGFTKEEANLNVNVKPTYGILDRVFTALEAEEKRKQTEQEYIKEKNKT